jgi:hypothetical protein
MSTRTPVAVLSLSAAALVSATIEPVVLATDSCVEPGENACPPPLQTPPDKPEHEREPAVTAPVSTEQAPPPPQAPTMPPSRGLQWEMYDDAAYQHHRAVQAQMDWLMHRNGALPDQPPREPGEKTGTPLAHLPPQNATK